MRLDDFVVLMVWRNAESGSSAHEGRATVCDVAGLYLSGLENTKKTVRPILNNTTTQRARSLELLLLLQCS
jgi:hypothetical protein